LPGDRAGALAAFGTNESAARVAIVSTGDSAWRILFTTREPGATFDREVQQTIASLRNLDVRDRRLARPLSLHIARVAGAADVRRFAERVGDADFGAQFILALNGFSDPGALRAGVALKVPEFDAP
jgi:predicted Zn-dependent protease